MTLMGIGVDYAGAGCVKITKDGYDPLTTPDAVRGAFLFNSKLSKDVKVHTAISDWRNLPIGYNTVEVNWDVFSSGPRPASSAYPPFEILKKNLWGSGLYYDLPLYESSRFSADGWYLGRYSVISFLGFEEDTRTVTVRNDEYGSFGQVLPGGTSFSMSVRPAAEGPAFNFTSEVPALFNAPSQQVTVWNLPGDESPIQYGEPMEPVSGQAQVVISPSFLRVSKPGFDAYTATGNQLSVDTSANPAKVISAQDVLVPSGLSSFPLGYDVPSNAVIDCVFYRGSAIYYPAGPFAEVIQSRYRLNGNNIEFNNGSGAMRARFMVIAYDGSPQTSGENSVFREFNDGNEDVFQLLRPGSSENPSFADIAVDSRWPSLQIIADGYIPAVAGANRTYQVNYDSAGLFPYLKFMTVHGPTQVTGIRAFNAQKMVRLPQVTMWNRTGGTSGGWPGGQTMGGNTCFVEYNDTRAIFNTSVGQPMYQTRTSTGITSTFDASPIAGIRYYVFGIAKK